VKELTEKQSSSRQDAKAQRGAEKKRKFFFAFPCVFAPWRELSSPGFFPDRADEAPFARRSRTAPQA